MFDRKPKQVISWTSDKGSLDDVSKQFAKERERMAQKGYSAGDPLIAEAGRSKKSWVALGILNFARSKQVPVSFLQ